ncbi:MAG: ROK family protein [Solirubrobacterales bacterium]|nr:ROK family protein [Solirubrobacterales bacterium]
MERASGPPLRGGIDLGGTKIEAIVVDAGHEVLGSSRHPTPSTGGPEAVAAELVAAIKDACEGAGAEPAALQGVGVGSPGVVDEATGAVSTARNLPDWEGSFELGATLSRELGTPVFVGNDVQVATDAEFALGAGRPYGSLLGVMWGTGVGGGIILDQKPWLGRGGAGEIGHVVVKIDGRRCPCGRRGCMEAYAGRAAMEARARQRVEKGEKTDLFKLMKDRGRTKLTSAVWAKALDRGDKLATELLDEAVEALGAGIASAQNLLEVEAIVIGGGLGVRLGEPFVRRIRKAMMPHTFNDAHPPDVLLAGLGDLGGALGAALLVSRRLEGEPAPVAVASSGGGAASAGDAPVGDAGSGGDGAETASTPAAGDSAPAGEAPGAEDVPSAL